MKLKRICVYTRRKRSLVTEHIISQRINDFKHMFPIEQTMQNKQLTYYGSVTSTTRLFDGT